LHEQLKPAEGVWLLADHTKSLRDQTYLSL
jgi:hypothetical protein